MIRKLPLFILLFILFCKAGIGQDIIPIRALKDTVNMHLKKNQKDIQDVVRGLFKTSKILKPDPDTKNTKKNFSFIPAAGYSLQTGVAAIVSGNVAFYTDTSSSTKLSNINSSITYSQYKQIIMPILVNIWAKENRYNYITDIRLLKYPSDIYGLGKGIDPNTDFEISYIGIKLHQTVLKSVSNNFYIGLGYFFDKFLNIKTQDSLSVNVSNAIAQQLGTSETASGIAARFLFDSRTNQINAMQGKYFNLTYRINQKIIGSNNNWQGLQLDARTYTKLSKTSKNVLAFWLFDWFTMGGKVPYLLLPSTGWDDSYNSGRGYIPGRFRGKSMMYFETEYRYSISQNGLLGGVAFFNLQHFSSDLSSSYNGLIPGFGAGLRIKLNKFSGTNLCIDYGIGVKGSRGFFVNLGEVF